MYMYTVTLNYTLHTLRICLGDQYLQTYVLCVWGGPLCLLQTI